MAITRAQQVRQMLREGSEPMEQAGVMNYMPSEMVTVPRIAKSSPNTPTAKLAYITPEEQDILVKLNLYGSLEGTIVKPLEEGVDQSQVAVFSIGKFVMEEKPFFNTQKEYEEGLEDSLTNPDEEESTELGDVEQKTTQGSLRPGFLRGAYGLNYMYRY